MRKRKLQKQPHSGKAAGGLSSGLLRRYAPRNPRHLTSQKTYFWHKVMQNLTVNDNIAFLDSDMLVHKDFTKVFSLDFEVAYLEKDFESKFRLNGGSIFVKDIEKGKLFFNQWLVECNKYADCGDLEKEEIENNYGGLDQYALHKTINLLSPSIKLIPACLGLYMTVFRFNTASP